MSSSTVHATDWSRLDELVRRWGGHSARPGELREFWRLYRAATARLAVLQAERRVDDEQYYLNRLVAAAHAKLYRRRSERSAGRRFLAFLASGWPTLVRRERALVGAATALFVAGGLLGAFYTARDPGFLGLVAPPEVLTAIDAGEMWTSGLLSVQPAASSFIFSNNLTVAILAFALGITAGLGTAWLLFMNGVSFGAITFAVTARGMATAFWGFVAAHGVLELPAIFIAGAAGLALGRGILMPGARPQRRSIASAARVGLQLLAGCGPVLLVAAAVEAWFSPAPYPGALKAVVAAVLAVGLVGYLISRPR